MAHVQSGDPAPSRAGRHRPSVGPSAETKRKHHRGKLVIVFRQHVAEEARRAGILKDGDRLMVVASATKEIREATSAIISGGASVIVATGAPMEAIIPMVATIAETAGNTNGYGLCDCRRGTSREYRFEPKWEVIELQTDTVVHLAGDRIVGQQEGRP